MAENTPITLATFTADATGTEINTSGGFYQIVCENAAGDGDADYGGGTITLQTSHEGGGWQDVYDNLAVKLEINSTNDYASIIQLKSGMLIRATMAGATSPDVKVKLI